MPNGHKKTLRDPTNVQMSQVVKGGTRGPQPARIKDPPAPKRMKKGK